MMPKTQTQLGSIVLIISSLAFASTAQAELPSNHNIFHNSHRYQHNKHHNMQKKNGKGYTIQKQNNRYHSNSYSRQNLFIRNTALTYGVRPFYLINNMDDGPLKNELLQCSGQSPKRTNFTVSHRGAPLQFPEHTLDGYMAAARMGAGMLECDVTFTKDKKLVCRHAQNDLHATTNILQTELAQKCTVPPKYDYKGLLTNANEIECKTSDITLEEFRTLKGKMDASNPQAKTIDEYLNATASWRTDLYSQEGKLFTLDEHIKLAELLGMKHIPELKDPSVSMPFNGYSLNEYRLAFLKKYKRYGVRANNFYPQSFDYETIKYWLKKEPYFAKNSAYLIDDSNETAPNKTFDKDDPTTWKHSPKELKAAGINVIAPATWLLVSHKNGKMVASEYAKQAKKAHLKMIAWTVERSGPLTTGGGWYYTGLQSVTNNDGDMMHYIDTLAQDVGVIGIFSDWPATVTYYANCKGL